jgi:hypothetical protein
MAVIVDGGHRDHLKLHDPPLVDNHVGYTTVDSLNESYRSRCNRKEVCVFREGCLAISCLVSTHLMSRVMERDCGGIPSITVDIEVFR